MDVERALSVLTNFATELTQKRIVDQLQTLVSSAQQQSNPSNDENFKNQLAALVATLNTTESNTWSPSQRRLLDQLKLSQCTGTGLRLRLEQILTVDGLTRSLAAQKLSQLLDSVRAAQNSSTQISTAFTQLGITPRSDIMERCEVAILLPVTQNRNTLEWFDADLDGFNKLLKNINEITGSPGTSPRVVGLSTGSWDVWVDMGIRAADILIKAMSALLSLRKNVAELRGTGNTLKPSTDTAQIVELIEALAKNRIEQGLDQIAVDIVNKSTSLDGDRKNELTNALSINVRFLAKKLDEGARLEINPPKELPQSEQQDKSPREISELRNTLDSIKGAAPLIAQMESAETPVLMLSEPQAPAAGTSPNPLPRP